MTNLNGLSPQALRAAMKGGTEAWGRWGSAEHHVRYAEPVVTRRRCRCGCKGRVTHNGKANGIALADGCELSVRRWVKS